MKNKESFLNRKHRISVTLATICILLIYTTASAASEMLDPYFGANGVVTTNFGGTNNNISSIVLQSNGKILLLGSAQGQTPVIMRYNSNGSVDNTFGTNGKLTINFGSKVAVQSDGKLVVGGSSNGDLVVARYNSNGIGLDNTFGSSGVAMFAATPGWDRYSFSDLAIESDGKIVIAGTQTNQGNFINLVLARFNSDGTPFQTDFSGGLIILDHPNFPNSRYNYAQAVAVQSDGKIVMSGGMMDDDGKGQISLVRFNPDSSIDTSTFGTNGKGTATAAVPGFHSHQSSMVLQPDGKIVIVGTASDNDDLHNDLVAARFNTNGALDTTFGGTGIVVTDFGANEFGVDVDLQADGKIVAVGTSSASSGDNLLIVRYNMNGSLDSTFGDNGKLINGTGTGSTSGAGIEIQPDSKIVVTGSREGEAILERYIVDAASHPIISVSYKSASNPDGTILEVGENTNSGGSLDRSATTFNVGDDAKDRQYRSILSFNTASLPDNAIVTSAHLDIKRQGLVGTDPFTTHGNLLLDIKSGTFSNNLALQLADFKAAGTQGAIQENISPLTSNWYTSQLNNINLSFINKVGVTQFRLRFATDDNDDMSADYLKFFSGDSTDANIPKLVITYFIP